VPQDVRKRYEVIERFAELEVLTVIRSNFSRPHLMSNLQRFFEPLKTFFEWRERHSESERFALIPPGADS
jgi:hypothetical protein